MKLKKVQSSQFSSLKSCLNPIHAHFLFFLNWTPVPYRIKHKGLFSAMFHWLQPIWSHPYIHSTQYLYYSSNIQFLSTPILTPNNMVNVFSIRVLFAFTSIMKKNPLNHTFLTYNFSLNFHNLYIIYGPLLSVFYAALYIICLFLYCFIMCYCVWLMSCWTCYDICLYTWRDAIVKNKQRSWK